VQAEPMKSMLKALGTKRLSALKPKYDEPPLNFAFQIQVAPLHRGGSGVAPPGGRDLPAAGAAPAPRDDLTGRAVQVNPIKPRLKPPGDERLKLKCDILLSTFAVKFNLRRYTLAQPAVGCKRRLSAVLELDGGCSAHTLRHVVHQPHSVPSYLEFNGTKHPTPWEASSMS